MGKIIRPGSDPPSRPYFILQVSYAFKSCFKTLKFDIKIKKKGGKHEKINIHFFRLYFCSLLISSQSFAETTMSQEGQYIFNSLGFYIGGVLVAFMAAGFCMLESGLVTTKSVSTIAAKNIGKFAICSLVFFLVGYNLAYGVPEGGYIGSFSIWTDSSDARTGYSGYSDWFFQTMFVCATASIVSGAVAERIKIWPFFIFAAIMAGVIYPISMGWQWGGGWLASFWIFRFCWINISSCLWWSSCTCWSNSSWR